MFDEKKQEIDAAFQKAAESARAFNADLMAMRNIEFPAIDLFSLDQTGIQFFLKHLKQFHHM